MMARLTHELITHGLELDYIFGSEFWTRNQVYHLICSQLAISPGPGPGLRDHPMVCPTINRSAFASLSSLAACPGLEKEL